MLKIYDDRSDFITVDFEWIISEKGIKQLKLI